MADVIINDEHLSDIADAIRSKTGTEDVYKPKEMAAAIESIEGRDPDCNGMHVPEEALVISGDCSYRFAYGGWDWFIEQCGDEITTSDISNANYMFYYSGELGEIPFDLNFANDTYYDCGYMFMTCNNLTSIGRLINMYPSNMGYMFNGCNCLRYLPEFVNLNLDRIKTYSYASASSMFNNCHSLRSVPEDFLKQIYMPACTRTYNVHFGSMFSNCYALDEIRGLNPQTGTITSNMFSSTFQSCSRVKDIIFATQDDGSSTPYSANWNSQVINLNNYVGYVKLASHILDYNSGITADKEVTDDASYQALKDEPDWWTLLPEYSRYNHDSAVNTINSLPDTSAYLATAGGTNTIKFEGEAGSGYGKAISTLTEEEIAVATAKGWTVTFA